jgi:peptidyl-prolyl cis-trans isomerase B (cyclophilin B)
MDAPLTPPLTVPATGTTTMTLSTNRGEIVIQIDRAKTPCTAASMAFLVGRHFYDHTSCHRLVTQIFALQCGDPTGTNEGGPGYQFADENLQPDKLPAYHPGDVAMANAGPDTNGSQFFFVYGISDLPGTSALWGHVTKGLDIINTVGAGGDDGAYNGPGDGHPKLPLIINSARIE